MWPGSSQRLKCQSAMMCVLGADRRVDDAPCVIAVRVSHQENHDKRHRIFHLLLTDHSICNRIWSSAVFGRQDVVPDRELCGLSETFTGGANGLTAAATTIQAHLEATTQKCIGTKSSSSGLYSDTRHSKFLVESASVRSRKAYSC